MSPKHVLIAIVGHVDHGRTALVKILTGIETDTLKEERERGLTIDAGFAPCKLRVGLKAIMALDLKPGSLDGRDGRVRCALPFGLD